MHVLFSFVPYSFQNNDDDDDDDDVVTTCRGGTVPSRPLLPTTTPCAQQNPLALTRHVRPNAVAATRPEQFFLSMYAMHHVQHPHTRGGRSAGRRPTRGSAWAMALCFLVLFVYGARATDYFISASSAKIGKTPDIIGLGTWRQLNSRIDRPRLNFWRGKNAGYKAGTWAAPGGMTSIGQKCAVLRGHVKGGI